jgi:shikimate kinase
VAAARVRNVAHGPCLRSRARLAALTGDALAALVEAGRAACAALGVDYPITEVGEREVRAMLDRDWPAPK